MPQSHAIAPGTGETDHEAGALFRLAFHFDPPAVEVDDAVYGRKPQPRTFCFCREEWQKNFVQIRRCDAFPRVLKGDFNDFAFASRGIDVTASGRDGQLSPVRHGVERIRREVPKHLPHLILIDLSQEGTARQ